LLAVVAKEMRAGAPLRTSVNRAMLLSKLSILAPQLLLLQLATAVVAVAAKK
jgi:hypothetical protein